MKLRVALVFFVVFLMACNQPDETVYDYRDAFIGEYIGLRVTSSWMLGGPTTSSEFADTVIVSAIGDSSLMIDLTEVPIGEDGYFFQQGGASVSSYYSASFFANDSLEIDYNSGGLGGGSHSTFLGKKQ